MDTAITIPPISQWPLKARVILFGVAYFACAWLGDILIFRPSNFTTFWPVSGFYVAILLLAPLREWPYFLLGALPANLAFDLLHQRPLLMALLFGIGNSLEAFTGAGLTRIFIRGKITLASPKEVLTLVFCSAVASTTLSAFFGTTTLAVLAEQQPYWSTWFTWWTGDMLGVLVMAPVVLIWRRLWKQPPQKLPVWRWVEAAVYVILVAVVTWIVFSDTPWTVIKGVYLLIPLIVFVALRFGMPGVVIIGFQLACLVVLRTSVSSTPVDMEQVLSLQAFLGTVLFMGLVLAAVLNQNEQERLAVRQSEERFRSVLENSLDAAYRRDLLTDRYDYLSPVIEQITGWPSEEMAVSDTDTIMARIHPADYPRVIAVLNYCETSARQNGNASEILLYRMRGKDGIYRWLEDHFTILTDEQRRPLFQMGIVRNATTRKQVEEALRISEANFRRIFEEAPIGMATVGANYHFLRANVAFGDMLGYDSEEISKMTFADITHPDHVAQDLIYVKKLIDGEISIYRTEKRYFRKDGAIVTADLTLTVNRDPEGNFLYFLAMVQDISERVRLLAELENRAVHDELTGALNRWGLFRTIQTELNRARRYNHPVSMILFDIDDFKQINDTYGHTAGDYILREVARLCMTQIRGSDSLARFGGDEFIILLPEINLELASQAAERLRLAIDQSTFQFEDIQIKVTVSIGVTVDPNSQFSLDQFLRCADRALYMAKQTGKNCIRSWTSIEI